MNTAVTYPKRSFKLHIYYIDWNFECLTYLDILPTDEIFNMAVQTWSKSLVDRCNILVSE